MRGDFAPTLSEEHDERGVEESRGHRLRIPHLKISCQMTRQCQQALRNGCTNEAITEHRPQTAAPELCRELYFNWNCVLWSDETKTDLFAHIQCHNFWCQRKACKEKHLTHNKVLWWIFGALGLFCFQQSGEICKGELYNEFHTIQNIIITAVFMRILQ